MTHSGHAPSMNRSSTIVTRTLACGMPLLIEPMRGVRSLGLTWLIPAGSAHDPEDRQGLSSMWSELLMRGAGELDSRGHADACDALGVSRSVDSGGLFLRVSATMLGERFAEALPLLVDMVRRPRFEAEAIEPARELALMAIEGLKDDPQERAMLELKRRHHPWPLNRSNLGTVEGLGAITHEEVMSGWRERAVPMGSILGIAGAIDPDRAVDLVERALEGWSGKRAEPVLGSMPARGYAHETDQSNQVQVIVAMDAPAEPESMSMAQKVAVNVLSGGMSGRLFTEVREKRGLCYSVSASYASEKQLGTLSAYVGTTPERAQESLDVLFAELKRITTDAGRVTPDEFRRAIVGMKSNVVFSGESTGARAAAIATDFHKRGYARSLAEIASQIDAVTLNDLNAYLANRPMGRVTIQTLGPSPLVPPAV